MADDGMLLNFDVGEAPAVAKATFKGGRWKDRLTAKKSAQHNGRRRDTGRGANAEPLGQRTTEVDTNTGRASKRQRTDTIPQPNARLQGGNKEVVSSLFTFNPKAKTSSAGQETEVPDEAPTNAPLPEGAANFTALGLGPRITTHLLQKLELKAPTAIQKATVSQLMKEDSDAFIQAETGSGKTLAYLLPIVERLISWSQEGKQMHRDSGLFAIILAPTRELCRQIQTVLESLLRCANWIVAGSVTGGESKKSEKARLRKGINVLVATPGRLADHFQNTSTLDLSSVRWLVLDEGDRLMDLGFDEEIKGIVDTLEKKQTSIGFRKPELNDGVLNGLPARRVTVLCSATMKMNVQKLGETSLKNAVHLQASGSKSDGQQETKFTAPAQMKQSYIVVPPKQRLVTLTALLKKTFARRGSVMKAIVFLTCADSVDFHFDVLRRGEQKHFAIEPVKPSPKAAEPQQTASPPPSPEEPAKKAIPVARGGKPAAASGPITQSLAPELSSASNPKLGIFRLHGSLAQPVRTSTLKAFSQTTEPAVLLCTDVASRGLDLPSIDLVIEFDPAFSVEDHVHRVGRTARAGREGRAILFLMPGPEEGYIELLEKEGSGEGGKRKIGHLDTDDVLKKGFSEDERAAKAQVEANVSKAKFVPLSGNKQWEEKATDWQIEAERWVLEDKRALEMARKAYISHVRAYATHVVPERHMFDVKGLHLGHLAKAFALRDRPGNMGRGTTATKKRAGPQGSSKRKSGGNAGGNDDNDEGPRDGQPDRDVMAQMRKLARARERDQAGEFNFG